MYDYVQYLNCVCMTMCNVWTVYVWLGAMFKLCMYEYVQCINCVCMNMYNV